MIDTSTRQHRQLDAAQKLLSRALDRSTPREQKTAIRKLYRMLLAGSWQPYELILVQAESRTEFAHIARLLRDIERLEIKLREKESRILEIAGDYQQLREQASKKAGRGSKRCATPLPPPVAEAVYEARIAELENVLHRMEKQFGFTDAMRLAINLWYHNLKPTDKFAGRVATRHWLRQHPGYEHGRVILDEGKLRWRKIG